MHAVVNFLSFREPIPSQLFAGAERDLCAPMQAIPGFGGLRIVQPSDTEAILLIFGDSPATLDRLASEVGSPWMREHVVLLLAGPPQRHVGPFVASFDGV